MIALAGGIDHLDLLLFCILMYYLYIETFIKLIPFCVRVEAP